MLAVFRYIIAILDFYVSHVGGAVQNNILYVQRRRIPRDWLQVKKNNKT